ncbi:hypothetical protein M0R45_014422 [Rubus argutus]|uniref:Uncharacterized protein n=1 Tax=Rubus argutus TaxID=59490 RepID=A0AAW1XMW4_RUBAR
MDYDFLSMEACNAHELYCVPLYDTLGAGAVEFVICHAEVSLAFVEEKKLSDLLKTLPNTSKYLKTLMSFGKVTPEQKDYESCLVALVNPNKQAIASWARQNDHVSGDHFNSLCENTKVKECLLGEMNKIAKETKLKGFVVIKALRLHPEPFDMERDLITPAYKKKRPQLLKYYKGVIDDMYKSVNQPKA